jgi:hypothetical protein
MQGFARYIISGQFQAFTVVFGFSILAFVMPLSAIISAAAIVLITLYATPKNGLLIAVICTVAIAIASLLLFKNAQLGAYTSILQLAPSLILASVLFSTRSLSFSIQIAALLGVLAFISVSLLVPDIQQHWVQALTSVLNKTMQTRGLDEQQQAQLIQTSAQFMTGVFIAIITLTHSTTLLIGNRWHSLVTEKHKQGNDFHQLRLGKVLAFAAIILGVLTAITQSIFIAQILAIVGLLFLLQGLAILHAVISKTAKATLLLTLSYGILIFMPQVCLLVIFTGLMDTFIDIRRRISANNA